jgi:tagatose 1,6-diphosphate aldolase GatY/KbaY
MMKAYKTETFRFCFPKEDMNMPIVTSEQMLLDAQAGGYAVGAFNAENMEMVKAIIQAAEELCAPVMIQTTPSTIRYGTLDTYAAIVAAEAENASVPVCLHLDHGSSFELAMQAIYAGYTSVMIDGSKLPFEENIAVSKKVADVAGALGIPCEAELGKVGGKEDDLEAVADTNTDPLEAKEFVERTGVTSLAVAIGTAHGFYVGTPVLDKERLSEIGQVVDIPLVLHGASGLSDDDVRDCVKRGICKVNFATELRAAYTKAVRELLEQDASVFDPKALGKAGIAAVKAQVMDRMKVCGCVGKA